MLLETGAQCQRQAHWALSTAVPFTSCVTLSDHHKIFGPQHFSSLKLAELTLCFNTGSQISAQCVFNNCLGTPLYKNSCPGQVVLRPAGTKA